MRAWRSVRACCEWPPKDRAAKAPVAAGRSHWGRRQRGDLVTQSPEQTHQSLTWEEMRLKGGRGPTTRDFVGTGRVINREVRQTGGYFNVYGRTSQGSARRRWRSVVRMTVWDQLMGKCSTSAAGDGPGCSAPSTPAHWALTAPLTQTAT